MDTIAFADLPEDMQCLIEQLVPESPEAEWSNELDDRLPESYWVPALLPLGTVPVMGLPAGPEMAIETDLGDDRDVAYALDIDPAEAPPLLVAHGFLLDGRHRTYSARARGMQKLQVIDLSDLVPVESVRSGRLGTVQGYRRNPAQETPTASGP